jgi:glycogen(starch) synthase
LAALLGDPAALRDLQQRQYAYAHTRFDVAAMVRNTLAFYREAAGLAPLTPPQSQPVAAHV